MSAVSSKQKEGTGSSAEKRKSQSFQEAFEFLFKDGVKTIQVSESLESVRNRAKDEGLASDQIHRLCTLACSSKYSQSVNTKLIRCLIPRTVVLSKTILAVMSAMCTGKLSFQFQALLIRWLIVVFEHIENKDIFHSMYDVIFHFLNSDLMCPYVCRLLYLLTRKEDVQVFRVRALLQLQQRKVKIRLQSIKGSESYLLGLLSVYKLYCPNLITLNIPTGKKSFFKTTDRSWILEITEVRKKIGVDIDTENNMHSDNNLSVISTPAHLIKKRRKALIPYVQPSVLSAIQTNKQQDKKSLQTNNKLVPFAQIKSFKELLQNLDHVELPSQLAVALRDRNLQHVLLCYPDPFIAKRIGYWLHHVLYDEFLVGFSSNDKQRGEELLYMLIKFSDFLQEGVPVCEDFLSMYLHTWNGTDYRPYILKLVTRCRLNSFQVFYDLILEPLRKLFFCSSVYFKCQIIICLTQLLQNLVMVEWPRYKYTVTRQRDNDIAVTSEDLTTNYYSVFSEEVDEFSGIQAIQEFAQFTDNMCQLGLEVEQDNVLLSHCVLSFFESVSAVFIDHGVPMVELCGRGVLYKHLFTNNAMLLSRMCDILIQYRKSLNDLRMVSQEGWTEEEIAARNQQIQQIPQFNSYILDFCDCLWRYKAFISSANNTVFKLVEGTEELNRVKTNHMTSSFSIHSHPALLGQVVEFQKQTQPAGLRISPHQIKHHKEVYMEFLNRQRLTGITSFIQTFIKLKTGNSSR